MERKYAGSEFRPTEREVIQKVLSGIDPDFLNELLEELRKNPELKEVFERLDEFDEEPEGWVNLGK